MKLRKKPCAKKMYQGSTEVGKVYLSADTLMMRVGSIGRNSDYNFVNLETGNLCTGSASFIEVDAEVVLL